MGRLLHFFSFVFGEKKAKNVHLDVCIVITPFPLEYNVYSFISSGVILKKKKLYGFAIWHGFCF